MASPVSSRDDLAERYLDQLPYAPYPVQEDALLAWFTAEQGVLVCAPTGTGKTLIAQAALFEALHTGTVAYYTTPLIALTEQKFHEMQAVGRALGLPGRRRRPRHRQPPRQPQRPRPRRRRRDPAQPPAAPARRFDFSHVSAVVMDEFHNFADPERGIVWELSLAMLPPHVRLLLLSATVGNAAEFLAWLERCHGRKLELVEGKERKVPLTFRWVPDEFLGEQLVDMAKGEGEDRTTPALVFCFNRDECWSVAEKLKGLDLLAAGVQRAAQRRGRQARLDAGRRAEAQADAAPRRRRPPRRPAAASIAASSRTCSRRSCWPSSSAPRRWRPASTCRRGRWC